MEAIGINLPVLITQLISFGILIGIGFAIIYTLMKKCR